MAFIQCDFFSDALGVSSSMNVILPQSSEKQIGMGASEKKEKYPVLYLLHGLSDDNTIWMRRTSIERYVAELGLIVVMPNVHRSWYTDMKNGYPYWTFISEELPAIVKNFFHVSEKREDSFAAGLSMGAYGALKLGLKKPENFAAVASLSGTVDIADFSEKFSESEEKTPGFKELTRVFGDLKQIQGSENDLFYLAEKNIEKNIAIPEIFLYCGTDDFLIEKNRLFKNHLEKLNIPCFYRESPGEHEWKHWDREIQQVLDWLPIKTQDE